MTEHRFPYKWQKKDLKKVKKHGHKVFSTFACGGGSSFGYKMAGFDVIGCNEIDPEMIEFYRKNHKPKFSYLEPIQDFKNRDDLPDELFELDLLDGSPPCFVAGTPVLTERGVLPIEQVKEGDYVFTHKKRWRKVVDTMSRVSPTVLVDNRIEATPDHRFLTRSPECSPEPRNLKEQEWTDAKDLQGMFLATPVDFLNSDVELANLDAPEGFEYSEEFWSMVGRWLGDSRAFQGEREDDALVMWLQENFGKGAYGKTMPGFVFCMNEKWRRALMTGYVEAVGAECDENYWVADVIGRCLLSGVNLLAHSLGMITSMVRRPCSDVVEGVEVNSWRLSIREDDDRYTEVIDGLRWKKMRRSVVPASELTTVYDITVEADHSFIADGYVVHNCSTFSMSGSREKVWGKEKKFREGQAKQVLSDLFFDYLDLVEKLRPKICVAENVKGMILGKAKGYCKLIMDRFNELGYDVQLFLLNAASMGVPQTRERVFFVARRRDLGLSALRMSFDEAPITFREVCENLPFQDLEETEPSGTHKAFWRRTRPGDSYSTILDGSYFNFARLSYDRPSPTIIGGGGDKFSHPEEMRTLSWIETSLIGSYPYDYDFFGKSAGKKVYCIGMSVPPVMTANIAACIAEQWFDVSPEKIDEAWS